MRIAIAGYNGFIGKSLVSHFAKQCSLILLPRDVLYDLKKLSVSLQGVDVVLNFAGYSVSKIWTKRNRSLMVQSRVIVTRNIVNALNSNGNRALLVNASGVNIYNQEGIHTESDSKYDNNFLSRLVNDWENEVKTYQGPFAILRLGVVLGEEGGLFPILKRLIKFCGGWTFGSGKQCFTSIHYKDVVGIVDWIIQRQLTGIYNAVLPECIDWTGFVRLLCENCHRPLIGKIPDWAIQLILGRQSILFLADIKVVPLNILNTGYKFRFPTANDCVNDLFLPKN